MGMAKGEGVIVPTVKLLIQIFAIMYWIIIGLLVLFKIYTPPRYVIASAFILTGILTALMMFARSPITKVYIHNH